MGLWLTRLLPAHEWQVVGTNCQKSWFWLTHVMLQSIQCLPCSALTPQAVDAVGEILLSLSYLPTAERLTVVVAKCKNLVWTNGKNTAGQGHSFVCCSVYCLKIWYNSVCEYLFLFLRIMHCMYTSVSAIKSVYIFLNDSHLTTEQNTLWLGNNRLLMPPPRRYIYLHSERQMQFNWPVHHIKCPHYSDKGHLLKQCHYHPLS